MATGRTVPKHLRGYIGGYDVSGYTRTAGPAVEKYQEADLTVWTDAAKGYLPNQSSVSLGKWNAVFDNTATSGFHTAFSAVNGATQSVLLAVGIRAAPAAGDPCFMGQFPTNYLYQPEKGGGAYVSMGFDQRAADSVSLAYSDPWGVLLHASGAETGANSAAGFDNDAALTSTTGGGYLLYQVLAGNGTATISVDDSANNSTWAALSGATTGSINCAVVGAGVVAIGRTATVRRYLRWQLALGTATTVTFVLGFSRAYF